MLKDIVISVLGAMVLSDYPWFQAGDVPEKIAIILGLAAVLFIFLLFLEEKVEKMRRVWEIRQILERLRSRELTG